MQLEQQETFAITGPQLEVLGRVESKLPAPARKKPAAALFLAALALVSVFGIGGLKLRGRYDRVCAAFSASDEYGNSLVQDLAAQADAAASLIRLGERILGAEDADVGYAAQALEAYNQSDKLNAAEQYRCNAQLTSAVGDLYLAAGRQADADTQAQLDALYAEVTSRQAIIEREPANGYNPRAQAYNETARSFPANVIGALWGAGQAPLFDPVDRGDGSAYVSAELAP